MIPVNVFDTDYEIEDQPSKTYHMHPDPEVIHGYADNLAAMEQVIFKILNTERYQYVIYSWDYGVELTDLYGKHVTYVCPELERRITEALMQDDRITGVDGFEFETAGRVVNAHFTVHTIHGDLQSGKAVSI